jgi:type IV pilus assembly protein PilM
MAWPILNGESKKKRNQILSVDLGCRTTKAVVMERRGENLALTHYALLDAPIFDKKISSELLAGHLREVVQKMDVHPKWITLAIGLDDAVLKQVELPQIPADDLRMILKNNPKVYLGQDLANHAFDCHISLPKNPQKTDPAKAGAAAVAPKLKVLVAGAKQELLNTYQAAILEAGMTADRVTPGVVGPINTFEVSMPEIFEKGTVALVDIGFKHSSICIVDRGELIMIRVLNIGGDKLTAGLAESMSISYAEAEGIKVGMAPEVQSALEMQVQPLGRELRASLDFFEHQHDRPVQQVYISGGSAQSELILEILHSEMLVDCKTWNPAQSLQMALRGQQAVEMEQIAPKLTVAIGAALAALH